MTGTIHNREAFLNKIAGRLGRDQPLTEVDKPNWSYHPQDKVLKDASKDELLDVLKKQCILIHTDLIVTTKQGLLETLQTRVSEYGGGPIVAWRDVRFTEYGVANLFKEWSGQGMEFHEWDASREHENIPYAEQANIGLTISDITLAESGTAVLFSSKDKGRTVSFLPMKSIILIAKSSIVPRMTQAARLIRKKTIEEGKLASCINFITGPSNSADIEMNLVVGVHGPINATYIVIEDL
ncbi:LutC/YkgG family protein [Cytobacillus purgationiresistens]|uniref:Lactate utilization protein C n=1 Tax=Cytobacillus purgationiresistens TaxID=863449 RepID=A0ABU0AMM4_9BACI|nr:lactate utilization protein C [Cytobacillus purgationiresistens]MDQ0272515.1 L-lactate dehydrogenase complex protein LldG [Cytobacillus purgationiresistens]